MNGGPSHIPTRHASLPSRHDWATINRPHGVSVEPRAPEAVQQHSCPLKSSKSWDLYLFSVGYSLSTMHRRGVSRCVPVAAAVRCLGHHRPFLSTRPQLMPSGPWTGTWVSPQNNGVKKDA